MKQYQFKPKEANSNPNYAYDDFHSHVSNLDESETGVITVKASEDYLERVFNISHPDGSGLCQKYDLIGGQ